MKNKKYIVIFIVIIAAVFTGCSNMLTENPNRSPTSVLSGNDYTLYPGVTQELDLSESYDVDEQPIAYYWEVTTSPSTTGYTLTGETESVAEFSATTVGSYQIEASVTDEYDVVDKKVVNILVTHDAPVATGGAGATRYPGVSYTLSGSATDDDPDGTASLTYAWSVVSAPATDSTYFLTDSNTAAPTFVTDFYADTETTYSTIPSYLGSYTLRLTVTDEWGLTDTSDVVVTVENDSPTADIANVTAPAADVQINLDGSGSDDPDSLNRQTAGDLKYEWSVSDSPIGSQWQWDVAALGTVASIDTVNTDNVTLLRMLKVYIL